MTATFTVHRTLGIRADGLTVKKKIRSPTNLGSNRPGKVGVMKEEFLSSKKIDAPAAAIYLPQGKKKERKKKRVCVRVASHRTRS